MTRVQLIMGRVKIILGLVLPALFLLVSADSFGVPTTGFGRDNLRRLHCSKGSGEHKAPLADNSFDSTVQRWTRRVNVQPGTDGFGPTATLAQPPSRPEQTIPSFVSLPASLERTQCWQFLWRTASDARAPSLVS